MRAKGRMVDLGLLRLLGLLCLEDERPWQKTNLPRVRLVSGDKESSLADALPAPTGPLLSEIKCTADAAATRCHHHTPSSEPDDHPNVTELSSWSSLALVSPSDSVGEFDL